MIEVLVTIVVLSIGLLGLAALQSRGQQFNHAAHVRTQATILAHDVMEKIRINKVFAKNDVASGAGLGKGYVANSKPGTMPDCVNADCTAAQIRDYDLYIWYDRLAATLPSGSGTITADISVASVVRYTVSITWSLRDNESDVGVETTKRTLSWMVQL
jgi:type IV pilus assembly protein PilV